jgi:hypothetical protein
MRFGRSTAYPKADRTAGGFEQRSFGFDVDGLGRLADLQLDVQLSLVSDAKDDSRLLVALEPGLFHGQRIFSGRQSEQVVFAMAIGRGLESRGGGLLLAGHLGFRDREAGWIVNGSEQLGFSGLAEAGKGNGHRDGRDVKKSHVV